jgi:hypothetical protein
MSAKRNLKAFMSFLNFNWWNHLERLDLFYYNLWQIEDEYCQVYEEMCSLLNVQVIVQEYHDLLKTTNQHNALRHYHFYINSMWNCISKINTYSDVQLLLLQCKLSNLLVHMFAFVSDLHHLDKGHGHRQKSIKHWF